ncbi:MAG TPA: hypothetical protein VGG12_01505, partial [Methylovirgula sp.]
MRANSSNDPDVLIVAPSGRALAASARRAGYRPLVVDFFDDLDTRLLSEATALMPDPDRGFVADALMARLDELTRGHAPVGLVYGGGFEDRTELIAKMDAQFRVFGNSAATVARVKDPVHLAGLCAALGIPHPEIALSPPDDPAQWLIKQKGGGGGSHIEPAVGRNTVEGEYYQRKVEGDPIS